MGTDDRWGRRLASLHLGAIGVALVAGVAAALALRWEHFASPASFPARVFDVIYTLHGAAMTLGVLVPAALLVLPYLVVQDALRSRPLFAWRLAYLSLAYWPLVAVAAVAQRPAWLRLAFAGGLAPILAHLVAVIARERRRVRGLAAVAAAGALGPFMVLVRIVEGDVGLGLAAGALPDACAFVVAASLPYLLERLGARWRGGLVPLIASLVLLAAPACVGSSGGTELARGVGAIVYAALAWRAALGTPTRAAAGLLYVSLGVVPALLLHSVARSLLGAATPDVDLFETTVPVAAFELLGGAVLFTLCASLCVWGRAPASGLARLSAVIVCPAFVAGDLVQAWLGLHGLPRGYQAYLPRFESAERLATGLAFIAALGGALAALSWVVEASGLTGRAARARPSR